MAAVKLERALPFLPRSAPGAFRSEAVSSQLAPRCHAGLKKVGSKVDAAPSRCRGGRPAQRLSSAIEQLDKAVDELHHAAEDKDASRAGLGLRKIKGLLPLIQARYPSGMLN